MSKLLVKIYKNRQHFSDNFDTLNWDCDRCIVLNWFDPSDIELTISALKSRLGEYKNSLRREQVSKQLIHMQNILNYNISEIYDECDSDSNELRSFLYWERDRQ